MRSILTSLLFLAIAAPALASDGVLEINQTCAVQTGCFAGDTAGYPVQISVPGSYRLTSNLDLTGESPAVDAILFGTPFNTGNVVIDLGGFEIAGPATCTGFSDTIACSNTGVGDGIDASGASEVQVRNGVIRNMGQSGIVILGTGLVEDMTFRHNGVDGISLGFSSTVSDVVSRENAGDGIEVAAGGIVRDSVGVGNGQSGIKVGQGSAIVAATTRDNGTVGIMGSTAVSISDSVAEFNRTIGISVAQGSVLRGVIAKSNVSIGIQAIGASVIDSGSYLNGSFGISAGASLVESCYVHGNQNTQIAGSGNMVRNNFVLGSGQDGIGITTNGGSIVGNTVIGISAVDAQSGILVTGSGVRVEHNNVRNFGTGVNVTGTSNYVLGNSVTDSTTPFSIAADNAKAVTVDLTVPATSVIPDGFTEPNVIFGP